MNIDEHMMAFVRRFGEVLDGDLGRLRCFHIYGVQVEGWLKGELLYFLDNEKKKGTVVDLDREVRIVLGNKGKRVDLRVSLEVQGEREDAWIELKHWLLEQKGTTYRPQFYFRTTDVTGIVTLPKGVEMVMPGDNVTFEVVLITEVAMKKELRFAIREGGRTVGAGVVSEVVE